MTTCGGVETYRFAERPFNDVDNVILARSPTSTSRASCRESATEAGMLARRVPRLLESAAGDVAPYVRSLAKIDTRFVELLADSRRFGSPARCSYVDVVDESGRCSSLRFRWTCHLARRTWPSVAPTARWWAGARTSC